MADVTTRLRYIYDPSGVNQAVSGMERLEGKSHSAFGNIAKSAAGFGLAMVGVSSITATVRGVFEGVIGAAASFEQQLNVLQAVTHASVDDMGRLDAEAVKLGADLTLPATSALNAANAMTELSKAGLSVNDVLGAAKGTLQLAAAANIEEGRAAQIAANALNAFRLSGDQATRVADLLAGVSAAASGEITDMADAFQMSSAVFSALGFNIEEMTTAIGLMAKQGIIGSDAGTSLKQAMLALINPTAKAKKELANMGVSIRDETGAMKPLRTLINEFTTATSKMGNAQRDTALDTIFGSDAIRAAFTVMTAGTDQYDEMFEAVTQAGEAERLATARTKGLAGAWEGLRSQLETAGLILGRPLLAGLTRSVQGLSRLVGGLTTMFTKNREAIGGMFSSVKARLTPAVSSLGKQFVALGKYLVHVVRDGDTMNDWLTHLSPAFRAVAYIIGTSIVQLQALGHALMEVARSPIARFLGDMLSSLLRLAFGVREGSSSVSAMIAPMNLAATALTGFIAVMAVQTVLGFTRALAGLASSILTFPLRPFMAASQAIIDFVGAAAGLVGKAVTITANVITRGAELAGELFQTVTQFVQRKGDPFLGPDDLADKTQTLTQKVDVKSPPDSVATGIAEKFGNLFGGVLAGLGIPIGTILFTRIATAGIGPRMIAAVSAIGGPWGKAIGLAALAAFAITVEEVGAPPVALALTVIGFDLEGWKKAFRVIGEETNKAIEGYRLAWEAQDFWSLPPLIDLEAWKLAFDTIGKEVARAIDGYRLAWKELDLTFMPPLIDKEAWGRAFNTIGTEISTAIAGYRLAWNALIASDWGLPDSVSKQLDEWVDAYRRWRDRIKGFFDEVGKLFGKTPTTVTTATTGNVGQQGEEETNDTTGPSPAFNFPMRAIPASSFQMPEFGDIEIPAPVMPEIAPFVIPPPDITGYAAGLSGAQSLAGGAIDAISSVLGNIPDLPVPDASGFLGVFAKTKRLAESTVSQMGVNLEALFDETVTNGVSIVSGLVRFFANDFVAGIRTGVNRAVETLGSLISGFRDTFNQLISSIVDFIGQAQNTFGQFRPWDAVSGAFSALISNAGSFLDGFLSLLSGAVSAAGNLWDQLTQQPAPSIPAPSIPSIPEPPPPVFVPTPTPPPYEQPPETGQEGFQTLPGQFRRIPGAFSEPTPIIAHGQEIIGRPSDPFQLSQPDTGITPSGDTTNNVTINISGPFTGPITVTNDADVEQVGQTIAQKLLDSLEGVIGQGTAFPHALNMRA